MSNLHPIFDEITQRALGMAHLSLGMARCTAGGVIARRNVLCQLPDHDDSTRHWAHDPVMGDVEWDDVPVLDPDMARKAADDDWEYYGERSERFDEEPGGSG